MTPEELLARMLAADAVYKAAREARRAASDAEDAARKEADVALVSLGLHLGQNKSVVVGNKVVTCGNLWSTPEIWVTDLVELS